MTEREIPRSVLIAAITSDIGRELARRYLALGCRVAGTYRPGSDVSPVQALGAIDLVPCDVADGDSVHEAARAVAALGDGGWTTFISAIGDLRPIGLFSEVAGPAWSASVHVNGGAQLELLGALLPIARPGSKQVCFLVGGGINGPFPRYSAYCLGKLTLVKACELLDDERPDVHAIAIGTGWVATRIHAQTIEAGARAGDNFDRTREFVERSEVGTSQDDIFRCIEWCFAQDREATGGRNISVVHDPWRDGAALGRVLVADPARFKLRRSGNA